MPARIHPRTRLKLQWLLAAILCLPYAFWWLKAIPEHQLKTFSHSSVCAFRLADGTPACLLNADGETIRKLIESGQFLASGEFESVRKSRSALFPAIADQRDSATLNLDPNHPAKRLPAIKAILPYLPNANIRAEFARNSNPGQILQATDQYNVISLAGIWAMFISMSLLGGIVLAFVTRHQRTVLNRRNAAGQCLGCGYPLPDVRRPCPECGRDIMANKIPPK